jgi:hypothetical protein
MPKHNSMALAAFTGLMLTLLGLHTLDAYLTVGYEYSARWNHKYEGKELLSLAVGVCNPFIQLCTCKLL